VINRYLLVIILFCLEVNSFSQKKLDLEKIRKEKLREIEKIEGLISKTNEDKKLTIAKINLIAKKISVRQEIITNLNNSIEEIDGKILLLSDDIATKDEKVNELRTQYSRIIYNSYYRLKNYNKLLFIFSATNFNQAYRRFYFLKQYAEERRNLILKIKYEIFDLENNITDLKNEKEKKQLLIDEKQSENEKLEADNKQQKQMIESYNSKAGNLKNELIELQEYANKIQAEIEKIVRDEALARKKKNSTSKINEDLLTKNFEDNKSNLPWPVDNGIIISSFGSHNFKGLNFKNDGIDISANCSSPVYSVFNGVVVKIIAIKGANLTVLIRHGEYLSLYKNLISVNVSTGEKVKTRQKLGNLYCDSESSTSTVHFELWQELNKIDPLLWLNK
jgi:septal ring factor EnvC (AmiA/AmiB activator)